MRHTTKTDSCVAIDLEVEKKSGRIKAIGAIRSDDPKQSINLSAGSLEQKLIQLDDLSDGADFVLGHNVKNFDLKFLNSANPRLRLLQLPVIDTLFLSPLAFPRNPYHHLVKHYKDGALMSGHRNNPEADARCALQLFNDQKKSLAEARAELLTAWHWLTTPADKDADAALDKMFSSIRQERKPTKADAVTAIQKCFENLVCCHSAPRLTDAVCADVNSIQKYGWQLAFALAWLSVAGEKSVVPPWVRHQFPDTGRMIRRLRDTACSNANCGWCAEHHNAKAQLHRWFKFDRFRPHPAGPDGRPMQQVIIEETMAGKHVLGIMPTGTGKSLCYQIPALSRYCNTGALTIVISPLVALMADQVAGLKSKGIDCCVTINSLLSMPERSDALDQVRLGEAGILLISPEQLRSKGCRSAIAQREIGLWVIDEAHCLSRWGHDFRPDYRYVGRFIKESATDLHIPTLLCLTATAKPAVISDITAYFAEKLQIELQVLNGGAERHNLEFKVIPTTSQRKAADVRGVLERYLPDDQPGGAIIYCATRRQTEDIADYLGTRGVLIKHFHANLPPESKSDVQASFIGGKVRVITATNAFGMGVDKPDVRLVIHADIPGSLENYLQEAGRAGRDNTAAWCVLLFDAEDVERQFGMAARSRLTRIEIQSLLRALRKLDRRNRFSADVIATPGEILYEEEDKFRRDTNTDDTRVRTAVSWLEEAALLKREENVVTVFPSSLLIKSVEAALKKLPDGLSDMQRQAMKRIIELLLAADPDEGVSTDELMETARLDPGATRAVLRDLEKYRILKDAMQITAYVHVGIERSSAKRLKEVKQLECALIDLLREEASEVSRGETWPLHFRSASQKLRDQGLNDPLPEKLSRLVRSIAQDGRGDGGGTGSLHVRKLDAEAAAVTLLREWAVLSDAAETRRDAADCLLRHLISDACIAPHSKGLDVLAQTTMGELLNQLESDIVLSSRSPKNLAKLCERALLWLHEQGVLRLHKGLTILHPAMRIRIERNWNSFTETDFEPLRIHYQGQVLQVHVMKAFAQLGLDESASAALRMAADYFAMDEAEFLQKWLPGQTQELERETTPESWQRIVESLHNPSQKRIVADNRKQTSVLVLAGPGALWSGSQNGAANTESVSRVCC